MSDFFVAEEKSEVVGCCAIVVYSPKIAEVRSLAVRKDFGGKGIATRLINVCVKKARARNVREFYRSRARFLSSTKWVSKRSIAKSTRFSRYFASPLSESLGLVWRLRRLSGPIGAFGPRILMAPSGVGLPKDCAVRASPTRTK